MISSGMRDDDDGVSSDAMGYGYGMVLSYRILSYLVSSVCTRTSYLPYRQTAVLSVSHPGKDGSQS